MQIHAVDKYGGIYGESTDLYDVFCIGRRQYECYLNILSGAVGSVDVWCSAGRCCRGRVFESR